MTVALSSATMTARARPPTTPAPPAASGAAISLAALVPSPDDVRKTIVVGSRGEVYAPDGAGAWTRTSRVTTADAIALAGRAGPNAFAFGEGVIYRLAPNGWTAIRLHQKDRAILASGDGAIAAVGRQLFTLERMAPNGEPLKLAFASAPVAAMTSSGKGVLVLTKTGAVLRFDGTRLVAVPNAPRKIVRLVGDRWAIVDDGAIDLRTGRKTGFPPGVSVAAASAGPDQRLVLVVGAGGALELVTVRPASNKLERVAIEGATDVIGVAVDAANRCVVAMRDGTILLRDGGVWKTVRVTEQIAVAGARGAGPAVSP